MKVNGAFFGGLVALLLLPTRAGARERDVTVDLWKESEVANSPSADEKTPDGERGALAWHLDQFAKFDELRYKGWDVTYPGTRDTIIQNKGGVRSALADLGIGFLGLSYNQAVYDLRGANRENGAFAYNGKNKPTYYLGTQNITLTYDMSKLSIRGGQIQFQGAVINNGLNRINGPRNVRVETLAYFQKLFDDSVEIKIGIIDNTQEFLGISVGGSSTGGALGPQATIPFQVGVNYNGFGTAALNVRLNGPSYLYSKTGVQRSLPPGGTTVEEVLNPSGLAVSVRGARPLIIQEIGLNRPASNGTRSVWIRAGGIYNFTRYQSFEPGDSPKRNSALFIAGDYQISQPDSAMPFKGAYGGLTMYVAPRSQNLFTKYSEARLYGIGVVDSRPFDIISLVVSRNVYSPVARKVFSPNQMQSAKSTTVIIGSYSYRLMAGLYIQPGLGTVFDPTVFPRSKNALNGYLGVTALF